MFLEIKNRIDKELKSFLKDTAKAYPPSVISSLLFASIREFISRKGKRVRPTLCVVGYLGFAKKAASGIYRSALSLELLHDFMLVHDDIIDKSLTRRGKPAMHSLFNKYLARYGNLKFNGEDLAIVAGDVMYALALEAFLQIKENKMNKEAALRRLIRAALFTGSGEFTELLYGIKNIDTFSQADVYKVYDLKTANYTFASPLSIGATLAGATTAQADKLFKYGILVGRAFQIKDDIQGIFSEEKETGKSSIADLQEAKKTILIWQAYNYSTGKDRLKIKCIFLKERVTRSDLLTIRDIIRKTRGLDFAKREIVSLLDRSERLLKPISMAKDYKSALKEYARQTLSV